MTLYSGTPNFILLTFSSTVLIILYIYIYIYIIYIYIYIYIYIIYDFIVLHYS